MSNAMGDVVDSLNELNILASAALGAFFMTSLVMVGLAGDAVTFLESHKFIPLTFSYAFMVIAFLSSGSRDVSDYYGFEKAFIVLIMAFMALFVWSPWVMLMGAFAPFSLIGAVILMTVATAILAR